MAIAKMKKFTLLTFQERKSSLLKELQKFEDVHFKSLSPDDFGELGLTDDVSSETIDRYEDELEKAKFSLSKIEPYAEKPKGLKALTAKPVTLEYGEFDSFADTYGLDAVYNVVQAETSNITSYRSEAAKLKSENESLKLWAGLDVPPEELDFKFAAGVIGTVGKMSAESVIQTACAKYEAVYIEYLGEVKDEALLLAIIPADIFEDVFNELRSLGFSRTAPGFKGLPAEASAANEKRIAELTAKQLEASNKIASYSGEFEKLQIVSDYYETALEREQVKRGFMKTETAVVMDGWVPADSFTDFTAILDKACGEDYYLEAEDVERDSEDVPIKLKNNSMVASFEGVTEMFSMPKYNDVDPTPIFMPFYMLFFGFMFGDAGFGLVLIVACWLILKFCTLKAGTRRFMKFFFYLGFATVFAGTIYGSAFGFTFFTPITMPDGTKKAILDSQLDVVTMMILSVVIGVVQVFFGLLVKAYVLARNGDVFAAVFDALFWLFAVASGIGWLLGMASVIPAAAGTASMWIFFLSILGLAATQGRESKTIPIKIVSGIYSVYGITSYVGDLVSYARIAALALSGAYIAFAFTIMSNLFPQGPVRWICGTIVYLFGLALNFGLSALGAYVHTLRLQYVEFFGKFYEGGGVPFKAFKLKNEHINIIK